MSINTVIVVVGSAAWYQQLRRQCPECSSSFEAVTSLKGLSKKFDGRPDDVVQLCVIESCTYLPAAEARPDRVRFLVCNSEAPSQLTPDPYAFFLEDTSEVNDKLLKSFLTFDTSSPSNDTDAELAGEAAAEREEAFFKELFDLVKNLLVNWNVPASTIPNPPDHLDGESFNHHLNQLWSSLSGHKFVHSELPIAPKSLPRIISGTTCLVKCLDLCTRTVFFSRSGPGRLPPYKAPRIDPSCVNNGEIDCDAGFLIAVLVVVLAAAPAPFQDITSEIQLVREELDLILRFPFQFVPPNYPNVCVLVGFRDRFEKKLKQCLECVNGQYSSDESTIALRFRGKKPQFA